jgi:hypothetical protein
VVIALGFLFSSFTTYVALFTAWRFGSPPMADPLFISPAAREWLPLTSSKPHLVLLTTPSLPALS